MRRKLQWLLPVAFAAAGTLLLQTGPWAGAAPETADSDVHRSINRFSHILGKVESHYVDEVDAQDAVYYGAIPYMLRTLDPHSSFFSPDQFKQLRDDQKGHYAGVGMQIGNRNGSTIVIAPFPRTPAYRAGLRPGDVIVEVDGENVEELDVTEVARRLRGDVNTSVRIGFERQGEDELRQVRVTRKRIPRPSIPTAFEIQPDVGFVRIDTFNEKTGSELDKALANLGIDDLKGLVLDLRDNRGGLLSEGVKVSDRFLDKGQMIVSHHGRSSRERRYSARRGHGGNVFPMVIMVNCNSASASEIVAGALQDHDRALIIGKSTFGKGLVQTVFTLSEKAGLALTTARYYTPSGRLIQRRYDGVSMVDYYSNPCSEGYRPQQDEMRLTDKGRRVFAGGGIAPDIEVDQQRPTDFQWLLTRRYAIFNFAQEYNHQNPDLPKGWDVTDEVVEQFRQFLLDDEDFEFEQADFEQNRDYIRRLIKREIYNSAFDIEEGQRVYFELDPDVQKALEALPRARRLLEGGASVVASAGQDQ